MIHIQERHKLNWVWLLVFFILSGCHQGQLEPIELITYNNMDHRVSIDYPSGWYVYDQTSESLFFQKMNELLSYEGYEPLIAVFSKNADPRFAPFIAIVKARPANKSKSYAPEDVSKNMHRQMSQAQEKYIQKPRDVKLGYVSAEKAVQRRSHHNIEFDEMTFFVHDPTDDRAVLLSAEHRNRAEYVPIFKRVAASFYSY